VCMAAAGVVVTSTTCTTALHAHSNTVAWQMGSSTELNNMISYNVPCQPTHYQSSKAAQQSTERRLNCRDE
jgi:hypothetical protein